MDFRKIENIRAGVETGLRDNENPNTFLLPLRREPVSSETGFRVRHRASLFNPERYFFATDLTALILPRPTSRDAAGIQVRRTGAWDGGTLPAMTTDRRDTAKYAGPEQSKSGTLRRWDGRRNFRKHHS